MYKVEKVEIDGFWHRFDASCNFKPEVNIIIGKNGTGKTTFMNILHSVLTVDIKGLSENDFETAKVTLVNGKRKRTIQVRKKEDDRSPYPFVDYQISQKIKRLRLVGTDDQRMPLSYKRRLHEASAEIRHELDELVSVSSLSVYRLRNDDEYEVRDRDGARVVSPVDYRLGQALRGLTQFQLELAQKARGVSEKLQTDVLASILYGEEDAAEIGYGLDFNKDDEQSRLISAYAQLNSFDSNIKKKIRFHVSSIDSAIKDIRETANNEGETPKKGIDIKPLEALRKTRRIIDLSLEAKDATQEIYSQIDMFLVTIKEFITDKYFKFISGRLVISNEHEEIDHARLSSGEKQLIILLIEALLQNRQSHIFLADEPELSLHIAWQRSIIPTVRKINPNAQVIVATHSPEVASKYRDSIFDMEELVHG